MRYPSLIRILVPVSGPGVFYLPDPKGLKPPVSVHAGSVPDPREALLWVEGGIAVALEWKDDDAPPTVAAPGEIETTMLGAPEAAVVRRGQRPGRRSNR